jgi:hypothetical protein
MALGETESGLFGLLANEPANVFKPMGVALEGLGASGIQDRPGMLGTAAGLRLGGTNQ